MWDRRNARPTRYCTSCGTKNSVLENVGQKMQDWKMQDQKMFGLRKEIWSANDIFHQSPKLYSFRSLGTGTPIAWNNSVKVDCFRAVL